MDYSKIKVLFCGREEIKKKADLFREKFWGNSIPVDIEKIIAIKFEIDIILLPNLQSLCDSDALITSNWKSVYVDNDKYLDDRYQYRLRFSLAHEIGHFVLHKDIYKSFDIKEVKDFYKLIEQIPQEQYSYLEIQAQKFANYLLIPREKLATERNRELKRRGNFEKVDKKTLNSYLTIPLSKIFCVSQEALEIALNELNES